MTGFWETVSRMNETRWGHTATLLQDGRVLVAGGNGLDVGLTRSTAEIFDPQTLEWTHTGSMNDPRWGHTATLLQDGQVLVAGGYEAAQFGVGIPVLASAELFSPTTNTWKRVPDMISAHAEHAATLLPGGEVFVANGNGGVVGEPAISLDLVEWFDPITETWHQKAKGNCRYAGTGTLLADTYMLLFSGSNFIGKAENPVFASNIYDPVHDALDDTLPLKYARAWHTATLLPDGTVLLAGGGTRLSANALAGFFEHADTPVEERYYPITHKLQQTASMQQRRHRHTSTLLQEGVVLVAGGNYFTTSKGSPTDVGSLRSAELYQMLPDSSPLDGSWTNGGDMNEARSCHTATLLQDGTVLIAGGIQLSSRKVLASVERFIFVMPC
ncbi:hypothetical protein KSD_42890 [Ktedonobacter sp. SOSP1-85]|uniref:Kelch repeat-containing protein n=1 Tax=Ktedonobacter sp. SOSP1-85 TaxID=2778367 RepID=UPI001915CC13|nr:kelch repeat-containing protein [Ktedonobacter sp. SOSP1-85]GHO76518.1 hypothetical protein KSD_42890 [Ktedonobacter sp. SOSP1-85]